ncbi:hypothetical protein BD560DRAFT_442671 [Blakeslea trispora]|nr:hypothetical protein BD560DRAFT_442671 [Blakeslea trispora]
MNQESNILAMMDQLPTLAEVLSRQTQPPICLYNYYIVLRDRLDMEILLDFWLDISQAELLYKRYIKHARQISVLSTPITPIPQSNPDHLYLDQRKSLLTQMDMTEVLERIYVRYIVPHAEKEIRQLPLLIRQPIINYFHQSTLDKSLLIDNPMVLYTDAKEFVYQLLETTFPLFLQYKVLMNMTLPQQIGRVGVDIHPWEKRLWGVLPILLGVFCLITSITGIDPIWVLVFNLSAISIQFNCTTPSQENIKKKIFAKLVVDCSNNHSHHDCILFITWKTSLNVH